MNTPILYRKRIIPDEIVLLDKDEILYSDENRIVTKWNTIRPKKMLHHGCSCYFLDEGFKVSKFYREDGSLIYWYCDIISYEYDKDKNTYIFTDLLADVLIYPDGEVQVVDVGEIADALTDKTLTVEQMIPALRSLDKLLNIIYSGEFSKIQDRINMIEKGENVQQLMETFFCRIDNDNIDKDLIDKAGRIIKAGGLVAFPTETVYGLGGDALNATSSKKIYAAKGRPSDNPLIVHIAELDDLYKVADDVPALAIKLADKYWPGPLTMIFKRKDIVPLETTGGLDTVAVRFPSHPVAREFIKAAGGFVSAPSANLSGRPSPTNAQHVREDLDGRIDMIIDSGSCTIGLESTIIDFTEGTPMMLRPGYVSERMLKDVLGEVSKDPAVFGDLTDAVPKAPGMKYRHYAPKGELVIVSGKADKVSDYILGELNKKANNTRIGVLACSDSISAYDKADFVGDIGARDDEAAIASRLYELLRRCDEENIDMIYSEEFDTPQLGLAIMNRLIKAAGHRIVRV